MNDNPSVCDEFINNEDMSDDDIFKSLSEKKQFWFCAEQYKNNKKDQVSAESESDFSLTQENSQSLYSPADIQNFLERTKGARLPVVGDHFSDLRLFIRSARPLTRKSGRFCDDVLTDQEIYWL